MKKLSCTILLLAVLTACGAGSPGKNGSALPKTTVQTAAKEKDTLVLDDLNDSVLITHLFPYLEYMEGLGFVYPNNEFDEGDTAFAEIVVSDTVEGPEDTLYFLCVQSPEYYQHGHTLHNQESAIVRKRGKHWVVTDTMAHSFVFDEVNHDTLRSMGPYFILTGAHAGSYNGGNYEAGEVFQVVYKGRIIAGLGYLSEADNGGSGQCDPPEVPDSTWTCNCYSKKGKGSVTLNKKTSMLLLEREETATYTSGPRCEEKGVVTERKSIAIYKSYSKTILENETRDGKTTVKMKMSEKVFLEEAKKALFQH